MPADAVLAAVNAAGIPESVFPGAPVIIGDPGPRQTFPPVVYNRGALTLHALRRRVGDEAFFTILRTWTARYRNSNATTEDFIALSEEVSGQALAPFFDGWLYQAALPDLAFDQR